jgi:hypothetical protein
MSFFNITDITVAGAFCNAMDALRESERRDARHQASVVVETPKTASGANVSHTSIREILGDALRHIGRAYRTEAA